MNPIANHQIHAPCCHGAFTGGRSQSVEQIRAGSLSLNRSAAVSLSTREGDTVTISIASLMTAEAGIQQHSEAEDGSRSAAGTAFLAFSDSRRLDVAVEGDLNAQEREEILAAMATVGGMIEDFLAGDMAALAEDASSLGEMETIAGLDAAFSVDRQVVFAEQERVTISDAAPQQRGHAHRRGHGRARRMMQHIDRLTGDMTDAVARFGGRKRHLARSITAMVDRYRDGAADNPSADPLRADALDAVRVGFAQKVDALFASSEIRFSYSA